MSAVKHGLPTSLTPGLMEEILRYEPRHWRAMKPRLLRKCPEVWKDMNFSDDAFYHKLHERLMDPTNREDFESEARRHDTRNRSRSLYKGMNRYYWDQLGGDESFREKMAARPSPRGIVEIVSQYEDADRLANVIWLHFIRGDFTDDELSDIAEEYPGVLERLAPVMQGGAAAADTADDRWEACLSRIKDALEAADAQEPDLGLLELLTDCVAELKDIVAEAERSSGFRSSLVELVRDHATVLCERSSLKPYVEGMQQPSSRVRVPSDPGEYLNQLGERVRSLAGVVQDILAKSEAISGADADKRTELGKEVGALSTTEERLCSEIEDLFLQVLPVDDEGRGSGRSDDTSGTSPPGKPEGEREGERPRLDTEEVSTTAREASAVTPSSDLPETGGQSAPPGSSDTLMDDVEGVAEAEPAVESTEALEDSVGTVGNEVPESTDLTSGEQRAEPVPAGTAPVPATSDRIDGSLEASVGRDLTTPESEALDAMLSSGRFARAYWLARADCTLGDPKLLGALSEGTRIGPGGSCPGALIQFFNGLAARDRWEDDDRLLLSASVFGACLFVDPLPQDIYLLASEFPPEGSPVGDLMQRVRELCVHQNAKLRPEDVGVEAADAVRAARLDQLASDAERFLQRVPHIRFQYAPADFAIQFVYRAGSEWHRLHTIVGGNQRHRLNEAQPLVKVLNPVEVVANLHDEDELSILKQPLEGRARDKLVRHLHDTLALAREWSRLVAVARDGSQGGNRTQSEELLAALERLVPAARKSLAPIRGRGPVDAIDSVLGDLEERLQGRAPVERSLILGDLLLLPGVVLEDDLEPVEGHLDDLRRAILEAERSEPEPEEVLSECLERQEYRRAREIIQVHELGDRARSEYQQAVSVKRSTLKSALEELEIQVEDAFLLGQLRDNVDTDESAPDHTTNVLERSTLLGVVDDALERLNGSAGSDADELRSISLLAHEVAQKTKEMTSLRRERLQREFSTVMEQLPGTEQGAADRVYLRETFDGFMKHDDHVAAFDLLDRGRKAAHEMTAVARATTGRSDELLRFLGRADRYRDALSRPDWSARAVKSIRDGSTFSDIPFGRLDRARRDQALSALQTWSAVVRLRFPNARRQLRESMDELLRFIGLPLRAHGVEVVDANQDGFAHIRATLSRPVTTSPLPAFGSACVDRYEVVVGQTRKEPEQFEEYIRGRKLGDRPVLAFLLPPQTPTYRTRWLRHFARARLTVLPLDLVVFLHLCGERNRLPVLFELTLPFAWSQPYITKGENVAREMFVGRQEETAALMDRDGSCIVFGGRQLGKSALLRHVHREHHDPDGSTYVVYLDVDDLGTGSEDHDSMVAAFWRRVYDELVRYGAVPELPQRVLDKGNRLVDAVRNGISTSLSENAEMRIILLLDETDDLLDVDSTRDFALVTRLRAMMASSERRFKVVFAGLQSVQRYYSWKNHPFAQLGRELVVNPLPPAAAQELIIRPLRALGFAFEDTRLVLRILSQTNYHPGLIQIFGYRLLDSLFRKWQRQETEGPVRQISSDDLLAVERNRSVIEDIRNRFDWTLDLDDRYKVLTYALVFTSDPTAPRLESEFMAIGADWWPAVFKTMDTQGLRAVLDEMVGLGVLLGEHDDSVRKYRLRSPNLLRLLGPEDVIEDELFRIIERDRVSRPNPRNFHPLIDQKPVAFGPLTMEQEGQVEGYRRPFQLTLVSGSEALGLGDVEPQFDRLFSDRKGEGRGRTWKKLSFGGPAPAEAFLKTLQGSLKAKRRLHRYAVVRLGDIGYDGEFSALFTRIERELSKVCTNDSRGNLILLLDPSDTWRWLGDRNRERVLSQPRVTGLELRRWSDGAIANAFDRLEARTGSLLAGGEVFGLTSGFHSLVDKGLSRVRIGSVANAGTLVERWETVRGEALTDGGIEMALQALGLRGTDPHLATSIGEVFRLKETKDARPVLTETSFDLVAEALDDGDREWFEENAFQVREWMRIMDLARPLGAREEGSMAVASWVQDVLDAVGD